MFLIVRLDGRFLSGQNVQSKFFALVKFNIEVQVKYFRHCGTGFKERRVECKQIMAQEHKVERRPELCPSIKPQEKKPCNTKACAPGSSVNSTKIFSMTL